jgi:hypothetical protein
VELEDIGDQDVVSVHSTVFCVKNWWHRLLCPLEEIVMDASTQINTVVGKLGKDEIFTFIYGFANGILYFLMVVVYFPNGELRSIKFINDNPYFLIFILLCFSLLFTFFIHIVYNFISYFLYNREAAEKFAESFFPDPNLVFSNKSLKDTGDLLHVYILSLSTLVLLLPYSLLFSKIHFQIRFKFSVHFLIWQIFALIFVLGWFLIRDQCLEYLKVIYLINWRRAKVAANEIQYSELANKIVDQFYLLKISQVNNIGLQNMSMGLSALFFK